MLKTGKLDSDLLRRIVIDKIKYKRPEVLTKAGIGEDCAVIDFDRYACVMSTDPITAAVSEIGRLAVHISCNDVASNGVEPIGIMLAVLLPEETTEEEIATMMEQAAEAAEACRVEIIGGHTEITAAVNQPVITSTAVGRALRGSCASAKDMQPGDYMLMTKSAGMEGSGILAGDYAETLSAVLSEEELAQARALLAQVSVVREGVVAGQIGTHGMHDVTEGGVLGAVWEMCHIAGLGGEIWEERIPIAPVTRKICAHFGLNPLRLISSGAMLIVAAPEKKEEILKKLAICGVPADVIGRVGEKGAPLELVKAGEGGREVIAPPGPDALYQVVK